MKNCHLLFLPCMLASSAAPAVSAPARAEDPSSALPIPSDVSAPKRVRAVGVEGDEFWVSDQIAGLGGVDALDRDDVVNLMVHAASVKCPDGRLESPLFDRPQPGGWRVEGLDTVYQLILYGWRESISDTHFTAIKAFEQGRPRRHITEVAVGMVPTNDWKTELLGLTITYKKAAAIAVEEAVVHSATLVHGSVPPPSESQSGAIRSIKRLFGL